ncbi:hypothetical protein EDD29_7533 [Actinocorallia herbida]|uniref:Uncharacterized protein n=1 Tax=Actinocorallia herbida TaxID=58109 RepID=A0A3N1D8G7_9ACTN|nr:hypothetical protein [Actinocorallia herbida]ROO89824.1 hypothetical protein EDD29_7533 [Actinocorallia herbida]
MFGELLLLAVAGDGPGTALQATFGEVRCPDRVVEVQVVNPGGADAFYELRTGDQVLRTEFIAAGTRLDSRVFLTGDGVPLRISVHDGQGAEIGAAERTAYCGTAATEPSAPAQEAAQAPEAPAETVPVPTGASPQGPAEEGAAPQEEAPEGEAAKGGEPGKAEGEGGGKGKPNARPDELPYTGQDTAAMGRTGAAILLTGGLLFWYGRLWPRTSARPCAPGAPRRRGA